MREQKNRFSAIKNGKIRSPILYKIKIKPTAARHFVGRLVCSKGNLSVIYFLCLFSDVYPHRGANAVIIIVNVVTSVKD